MRLPGVLGMASLMAGLALAIPMVIIGLEFLARGDTWLGGAFLALGVALAFLPEYVARQIPSPKQVLLSKIGLRRGEE